MRPATTSAVISLGSSGISRRNLMQGFSFRIGRTFENINKNSIWHLTLKCKGFLPNVPPTYLGSRHLTQIELQIEIIVHVNFSKHIIDRNKTTFVTFSYFQSLEANYATHK